MRFSNGVISMNNSWGTYSSEISEFVFRLLIGAEEIIEENFVGFYIHGSLAMGGFNPKSSDMDILIVTELPIAIESKRKLAEFFLMNSNNPFPIEITVLNKVQLMDWKHPCPYDFHYSEFWRDRYESDLFNGTYQYLNDTELEDGDLAAHITIVNQRGMCLAGSPIKELFPFVPRKDFITSIMTDFEECLQNIKQNPVYCTLNLLRVYWYLKEGVISSKQEAGDWGLATLPKEFFSTIQGVVDCYAGLKQTHDLNEDVLMNIRDHIEFSVEELVRDECIL